MSVASEQLIAIIGEPGFLSESAERALAKHAIQILGPYHPGDALGILASPIKVDAAIVELSIEERYFSRVVEALEAKSVPYVFAVSRAPEDPTGGLSYRGFVMSDQAGDIDAILSKFCASRR